MKRFITPKFLRRIRIRGGEFDASARAMHRKAAVEKVSSATIERKLMSTKTTFKRVALVAVVALGFGMLSGVAANAAPTFTASATYAAASGNTTTQVVGGQVGVDITSGASDSTTTVTVAGVGTIVSNSGTLVGGGGLTTTPTPVTSGVNTFTFPGALSVDHLVLGSGVAGVTTVTATPIAAGGTPGTAVVYTITWGAAAVLTGQTSSAHLNSGTATVSNTAVAASPNVASSITELSTNTAYISTDTPVSAAAGLTRVATIVASAFDTNGIDITPVSTFTATISGPGTLGISTVAGSAGQVATGRALSSVSAGQNVIGVFGDGTSGVSTITISVGSVVISTKTITFYGAASKATATQNLFVAGAGLQLGVTTSSATPDYSNVANTPAITATVVDAAGNAVAGGTVKIVSSDSTVIVAGACYQESAVPGTWNCSVTGAVGAASGKTATVTVEVYNSATLAYDILAAAKTFTIGGAVAKLVLSTDSASYAPLAPVKLVVTATDAAGNAAYDTDSHMFSSSLVSSVQLGGASLPVAYSATGPVGIYTLVNGVHTFSGFYAPAVAGAFIISGADNTTAANAISVTATVTGAAGDTTLTDAVAQATDAANAASDAALTAADSADAATAAATAAQDSADAATAAVLALGLRVAVLYAATRTQVLRLQALLVRLIKKLHA